MDIINGNLGKHFEWSFGSRATRPSCHTWSWQSQVDKLVAGQFRFLCCHFSMPFLKSGSADKHEQVVFLSFFTPTSQSFQKSSCKKSTFGNKTMHPSGEEQWIFLCRGDVSFLRRCLHLIDPIVCWTSIPFPFAVWVPGCWLCHLQQSWDSRGFVT